MTTAISVLECWREIARLSRPLTIKSKDGSSESWRFTVDDYGAFAVCWVDHEIWENRHEQSLSTARFKLPLVMKTLDFPAMITAFREAFELVKQETVPVSPLTLNSISLPDRMVEVKKVKSKFIVEMGAA